MIDICHWYQRSSTLTPNQLQWLDDGTYATNCMTQCEVSIIVIIVNDHLAHYLIFTLAY